MDKDKVFYGQDGKFEQNTIIHNGLNYISLAVWTPFGVNAEDLNCENCIVKGTQACELFPCLPNERADNTMAYYVLNYTDKMNIRNDMLRDLIRKEADERREEIALKKTETINYKPKNYFKKLIQLIIKF